MVSGYDAVTECMFTNISNPHRGRERERGREGERERGGGGRAGRGGEGERAQSAIIITCLGRLAHTQPTLFRIELFCMTKFQNYLAYNYKAQVQARLIH